MNRHARLSGALLIVLLGSGPLWNCECEEEHFAPPQLKVDKTVLTFEDVAVGYPQKRILVVQNTGGTALTLDRVEIRSGQGPFSILGVEKTGGLEQLPKFLGPAQAIRLVVQYDPATETSVDHDVLDLITNDPDPCNPQDLTENPCAIALSGNGAPPNAELEVVCQSDQLCPLPGQPAQCQVMLDSQTNIHPVRLSLNFCEVAAGYSRQLQALLRNAGNIPLTMQGFELFSIVGDLGDFALLEPKEKNLEIPPRGEQMLTLVYAPKAEGADNAGMDLTTNDTDIPSGAFSVRMLAYCAEPDIDVNPRHIPFEGVVQGSSASVDVNINNTGTGTLEITGLVTTGGSQAGEFSVDLSAPFSIPPMGSRVMKVTYSPKDAGRDDGSVIITSNDPDEPEVVVTLGAEVRPDLEVTPADWVEFVGVEMGGSASETVNLRNVGYAELTITAIGFNPQYNPGNPPVFGVQGLPAGFPAQPIVLKPAQSIDFTVTFTDNPAIENEMGQLEISHDSPNDPSPYLLLAINKGTPANLPPVAVIKPPSLTQQGFARVVLDGSQSFDPNSGDSITRYEWSFLFLPQDAQGNRSQAVLESTNTPQTAFTPDLAGAYIVRLTVFDKYSTPSRPADAEISVTP
jgi:hypothetical protein